MSKPKKHVFDDHDEWYFNGELHREDGPANTKNGIAMANFIEKMGQPSNGLVVLNFGIKTMNAIEKMALLAYGRTIMKNGGSTGWNIPKKNGLKKS